LEKRKGWDGRYRIIDICARKMTPGIATNTVTKFIRPENTDANKKTYEDCEIWTFPTANKNLASQ